MDLLSFSYMSAWNRCKIAMSWLFIIHWYLYREVIWELSDNCLFWPAEEWWAPCISSLCMCLDPALQLQAHKPTDHKQCTPRSQNIPVWSPLLSAHSLHLHLCKMFTFTCWSSFLETEQTWYMKPETLNLVSFSRHLKDLWGTHSGLANTTSSFSLVTT